MLHFYHFIFHFHMNLVVIDKFSFYYFLNYNISKMVIFHNFNQVLLQKLFIFVQLLFYLKKNRLNTLLTNTITLVEVFKRL